MRVLIFIFMLSAYTVFCPGQESTEGLAGKAMEETLIPVRPGVHGQKPFWNQYAMRFIHAPAFDFKEVRDAVSYRFTLISFASMEADTFMANHPWSALTLVWRTLPVGEVFLRVEGMGKAGNVLGLSGERKFYRAAPFSGPYRKAKTDYHLAGERLLAYIFHLDHVQQWLTNRAPDPDYILNAYPGKIIASTITAMLKFAELSAEKSPEKAGRAVLIATLAADYLIGQSEPPGSALPFLPPTYAGDQVVALGNQGKVMTSICARVGESYLALYEVTGRDKYLLAATNIAETLASIQSPQGVWPIKLQTATGQEDTPNYGIPIDIIRFFDRLIEDFDQTQYLTARDKAWQWILEHPLKTYHWEGQFEDVNPGKDAYRLMGMPDACLVSAYLLAQHKDHPGYLEKALELVRFIEDQFVVWEWPLPFGQQDEPTDTWFTPSVLEQYICYTPIDACAAMVSGLFYDAYEATRETLYLEKSRALANSLTQKQDRNGNIPTGWDTVPPTRIRYWWLNCATEDALFLVDYQVP